MRILIILFAAFIITGHTQSKQEQLPNIIYIYADDLGYGELGCYGQQKIKTPNLDKMAAEGMRFTQHYSGAPVCAPSRCMLLSGKHSGHSYIRGNYELGGFEDQKEGGQMPLPELFPTVASMLKEKGYVTGAVGKWGLGMANTTGDPNKHGFDYYFGYMDQKQAHNYYPTHLWENGKKYPLKNPYFSPHQKLAAEPSDPKEYDKFKGTEYAPDVMTEKVLKFIQDNKAKRFFLYVPYTLPHLALQVPDAALEQYKGKFDEKPYLGEQRYLPHPYPLSAYASMISTLDSYVGRIMKLINDLGLDNNTLIMFSSDNGPTFTGGSNRHFFNSTGGLRGCKMELYEGGIRVPFIVRWKNKVVPGSVSDVVSTQYDMYATLADLTKSRQGNTDGRSLLSVFLGKAKTIERDYLYFEYPESNGQQAVRLGNWKAVKMNMIKGNSKWELFDLSTDVNETKDISGLHPEILKQIEEIAKKEHVPSHIREWDFVDPKFD